jgi:imidazolonepropionase-like amidohydrolase
MGALALRNALVVSDSHTSPSRSALLIENGVVNSLRPEAAEERQLPSLDLDGRTVIPGLMDVHVHQAHLSLPQIDELGVTARDLVPFRAYSAGRRLLDAGFTCVRDAGAEGSALFALRAAAAHGLVNAPRLVLSGQIISVTSIGSRIYGDMYDVADGPDALRAAVRRQVARGADVIKVMVDGATNIRYDDLDRPEVTADELDAIVHEARRLRRPVACHVEGVSPESLELAVAAGVQSIEHAPMAHRTPAALAAMAEAGTILVPTLAAYDREATSDGSPAWLRERSKRTLEHAMETVRAALKAGVRIAAGSDGEPAIDSRRELELLGEAGLTAQQVLGAATEQSARACGLGDQVGRLHPKLAADLVVLDTRQAPAIDDLGRPDRVWAVMVGGQVVAGSLEAQAVFRDAVSLSTLA